MREIRVTVARLEDLGSFMDAANLVARGCSVIPIRTDSKKPAVTSWKAYQTRKPTVDELVDWFIGKPRNVAIVTGSISNIVVVDIEDDHSLAWARQHLPRTDKRVRTGGGGQHWYYRHPGTPVRNRVRIKADDPAVKIDIRADHGYVLAPGSIHPVTGRVYEGSGLASERVCQGSDLSPFQRPK